MPSRECLASINLHPVSSGVGKFSAELDLVDSSTPPVRPITISGREFRSKPSANRAESHSPSRSFTNPSIQFVGFLPRFHHRALSAKWDGDKKGHTCPPSFCSCQR